MSVRIRLVSNPANPADTIDTTLYATPAAAIAAISNGFLAVNYPSRTTTGGPPSPENGMINTSQISQIIQL